MTGHVVVPTEPCEEDRRFFGDPDTPLCLSTHRLGPNVKRCDGCLWNGQRAQLLDAVPVERHYVDAWDAEAWAEVVE